jgi:SAM-dependent methyltransferase
MSEALQELFKDPIKVYKNFIYTDRDSETLLEYNQGQTQDTFSTKWKEVEQLEEAEKLYIFQYEWFLKLYGFGSEEEFANYLKGQKVIIDTGCGLGYKAAWFAKLAPESLVIGIDISDAVLLAAKNFSAHKNLYFMRGDIANTALKENSVNFVVCDQVIMHTEMPEKTFAHLASLTAQGGEFACYVYRKKALPRELIDDYFRIQTHNIPDEKMWEFSSQLTELGKRLSELKVSFECPDIPVLGIKGGTYDIQRFIYWNFLKCFWKEDWGFDLSRSTNYDWYAPSNAKRFTREEFELMINESNLSIIFFHEEEACYSGRLKNNI